MRRKSKVLSSRSSSAASLSRYCRKRIPAARSSRAKPSIDRPARSTRPASRMGYSRGRLHFGEKLLAAKFLALEESLHVVGVKMSLAELRVIQNAAVQRDGGVDTL